MVILDTLFSSLKNNDWIIQLLILVILVLNLVVLIVTLVYYHFQTKFLRKQISIQNEQTKIQNDLYKAQVFKDRIDMYNRSEELITEEHIKDFNRFPEDYIDPSKIQDYKNDKDKIFKHMFYLKKYDYMAFVYLLKNHLSVDDPLGDDWEKETIKSIASNDDEIFKAIREMNEPFNPEFEKHLIKQFARFKKTKSTEES